MFRHFDRREKKSIAHSPQSEQDLPPKPPPICGFTIQHWQITLSSILVVVGTLAIAGGSIGLAGVVKLDTNQLEPMVSSIIAGLFMIVTAIIGAFSVIQPHTGLYMAFRILLSISFVNNLVTTIFLGIVLSSTQWFLKEHYGKYWTDDYARETIDKNQRLYECCGVDGVDFFRGYLPLSCCSEGVIKKEKFCSVELAFKDGCANKLLEKGGVRGFLVGMIVLNVILTIFNFLAIIFACILVRRRHEEEK